MALILRSCFTFSKKNTPRKTPRKKQQYIHSHQLTFPVKDFVFFTSLGTWQLKNERRDGLIVLFGYSRIHAWCPTKDWQVNGWRKGRNIRFSFLEHTCYSKSTKVELPRYKKILSYLTKIYDNLKIRLWKLYLNLPFMARRRPSIV